MYLFFYKDKKREKADQQKPDSQLIRQTLTPEFRK